MSTLTNAQLAAKTADEIQKRGLTHGELVAELDWNDGSPPREDQLQICKVCSIGGMAAAYYGDPTKGYDEDGNGYDSFANAVATRLLPKWRGSGYYDTPMEVIYSWNDGRAKTDFAEDPTKTTAEVVAFFRQLAAVWSADDALQAATAAGTDVVSTDV